MTASGLGTADYELEGWAREILLGSRRPRGDEEIQAYRILTRVSPGSYQAHLATALTYYLAGIRFDLQLRLALAQEALTGALRIPQGRRGRGEVILRALAWNQSTLYTLGHRAEGLAVREQMAQVTRAGEPPIHTDGLAVLAYGLAEEGRFEEAATILTESLRHWSRRPDPWDRLCLAACLDAAGRPGAAAAALPARVDTKPAEAFHLTVWRAELLDRAGKPGEAAQARHQGLELLREAAGSGKNRSTAGKGSATAGRGQATARGGPVVAGSGPARDELVLAATVLGARAQCVEAQYPRPPFGVPERRWSCDVAAAYADDTYLLRKEAQQDARLWRRVAVRTAVHGLQRCHRPPFDEILQPFHDSVAVTGADDAGALAAALTDRAMLLVAAHRYGEALTDYQRVLTLTNSQAPSSQAPSSQASSSGRPQEPSVS